MDECVYFLAAQWWLAPSALFAGLALGVLLGSHLAIRKST
jgi:hypothetical protein